MMVQPIISNCDAQCDICGMKNVCTASPYNIIYYYEKRIRNN